MVVCLERDADLHTAQLMPLPLTVSCFSKIQIGSPFWYRLARVVLDKGPLNGCVCVCVCGRVNSDFAAKVCCAEETKQKAGRAHTGLSTRF